jgi:hypothetical protein
MCAFNAASSLHVLRTGLSRLQGQQVAKSTARLQRTENSENELYKTYAPDLIVTKSNKGLKANQTGAWEDAKTIILPQPRGCSSARFVLV